MESGTSAACLACDIGGSTVSAGVVLRSGSIQGRVDRSLDSRASAADILDELADVLARVLDASEAAPDCIGLAVPGPFDESSGSFRITDQGKFESLHGLPLLPELLARLPELDGLPAMFVNDARAFALGELRFGAAQGSGRVLVLTLGTGCGSAFAVDGKLVTSGEGVPEGGFVYALGFAGLTVDEQFSTRGLKRRWESLGRSGISVAGMAQLARSGDPEALAVFRAFGREFIQALEPVLRDFAADRLVTGGGIARAFDYFAPAAKEEVAALGLDLELRAAHSLDNSALLGAAWLALGGADP